MKKTLIPLAALALAACGGSSGSATGSDAQFAAAAPSYEHVSMQIDDADATPSEAVATTQQDVTAPDCHPHLFVRTHDIVSLVNRHLWKLLKHERALIAANSKLQAGDSRTWEDVDNGIGRKFEMSLAADGKTYSFELDLSSNPTAATPAWVKVMTGSLASSTTGTVTETTGSVAFDFSALQSVVATEKASGQITANIDFVRDTSRPAGQQTKRSINYSLTSFLPDTGNPHGPQTGTYTHLGEPGVGGYFSYSDSLILLCPSNPNNAAADLKTFARWYQNNGVHGRSDAQATGGQIPAADKWEGVSCYTGVKGQATNSTTESSAYWMMKLEDGSGNTVSGSSNEHVGSGVDPCDSAFGATPSLTNNATDFDFTKLPTAPIFPGQW